MATIHEQFKFNSKQRCKYWSLGSGSASSPKAFANDHTIIKDHNDVYHVIGIKKTTEDADANRNADLFHISTTDWYNWTTLPDIKASELGDVSFATNQWGASPDGLWAPHAMENPTKDVTGTLHSERYVMAVTAVKYESWKSWQLVVLGYSDDLSTWTWDTEAIYDPLNATDAAVPVWTYNFAADSAHWRDPKFFLDPSDSEWYMAICALADGGNGAIARLQWTGTTDFSTGWQLVTPGSATGAMFVHLDDTDVPEGPGVFYQSDHNEVDHYWIYWSDQGAAGGQRLMKVRDLTGIPFDRTGDSDVVAEWIHSATCGLDANHGDEDYERGWGSGWEMIASGTANKHILSRFFTNVAEATDETWLRHSFYDIGTIDFTTQDTDDSPLVEWGVGLDPTDWPTRWGMAFSNQPTFGDPKNDSVRELSDYVIYTAHLWLCAADHTSSAANAPGQDATWTDEGAASAGEILEYDAWVTATEYYQQDNVSAGLSDSQYEPMYIDTWENRPAAHTTFTDSADSLQKTGYIKSRVWSLQGDRIGLKVGGGGSAYEFVALVEAATNRCIFVEYGDKKYTMTDRLWDIAPVAGTAVYLCVADMYAKSPDGWIACDTIQEYTMGAGDTDASNPTAPTVIESRSLLDTLLGVTVPAQITELQNAALYDAVASRLHCDPEECIPLAADIDAWALDCLRWLLPLAPEYAVESVIQTQARVSGTKITSLAADVLKVVRVSHATDGDACRYVPPAGFASIENQALSDDYYVALESSIGVGQYGKGSRVWSDVMGAIKAHRVASTDMLNIDYIAVPSWLGTTLTIPHGWDGMVATYCAAQVRAKQGKLAEAKQLREMLRDELTRFAGFEEAAISVGG